MEMRDKNSMKIQTVNSRRTRLVLSLVACPIFGWILWKGSDQTPLSWIANLFLTPGTFLALLLVGAHGKASAFFAVELTITAICILATTYGLLTLFLRILERKSAGGPPLKP
jgi:hypothetical protein